MAGTMIWQLYAVQALPGGLLSSDFHTSLNSYKIALHGSTLFNSEKFQMELPLL
jgi:hypothetical protein